MLRSALLLAVALAALPAAAEPPVDPALRERVRHLLSGYEHVPTAEELRAIPDVDRVLAALALDGAAPGLLRARALSSMATALPASNERVATTMKAVLADEGAHPRLRRAAAKSWVALRGPAALPELRPLLEHADPKLRDAAIEALARHAAAPAVRDALRARLAREAPGALRDRLAALAAP